MDTEQINKIIKGLHITNPDTKSIDCDTLSWYIQLAMQSEDCPCSDMLIIYLTLHNMLLERPDLFPNYSHFIYDNGKVIVSEKVGDVSVTYKQTNDGNDFYHQTFYGKKYLDLLANGRRKFAGVLITSC